jgi:hypothetical protein
MSALREILPARQLAGEYHRRWFTSESLDLFVWSDEEGALQAFQFTYDKGKRERAISWHADAGLSHDIVDDGEGLVRGMYKATPLLRPAGQADAIAIEQTLRAFGANVPMEIIAFIRAKLHEEEDGGQGPHRMR